MATADAVDLIDGLAELKERLRDELSVLDHAQLTTPCIVRVEREINRVSPFSVVHRAYADRKIYWRDREKSVALAAIGAADVITGTGVDDAPRMLALAQARLATCEYQARYYGGFRFDRFDGAAEIAPEWRSFGGAQLILPLVEIVHTAKSTRLALQCLVDPAKSFSVEAILKEIDGATKYLDTKSVGHHRAWMTETNPAREIWQTNVARALSEIQKGTIQKVVLARKVSCATDAPVAFMELARMTFARGMSTSLFAFQMSLSAGFFGSTPEFLYRRRDREIISEAIAGTQPESKLTGDVRHDADDFLASAKDRREVELVREAITEALAPLCESVLSGVSPRILNTGTVRHLRFPVAGELKAETSDADLLVALSPTPAVCGTLPEKAMALIRELEGFDRGWYAGPVGWMSRNAADFAVAIRSALVNGNTVHLYSGAGIVEGSEASAEWDELDAKIATLKSALGA